MQVDYIIVGQGICGTMLSWFLHKEGKTFLVMDEERPESSSRVAAGMINPVTGRRYAYSWMIEEVMPFAMQVYEEMGNYLGINLLHPKSIIDFFPHPQARIAFIERLAENDTYLHSFPDQNHFNQYFNYDFGCGEIRPACIVDLQLLLQSWRRKLIELNTLRAGSFHVNEIKQEEDHIIYEDIVAEKIIFCEGITATVNPWFQLLPFSANKGEALIIDSPELTNEHIYKKGMMLVPLPSGLFWLGSNYQWEFENELPSSKFLDQCTTLLNHWLKKNYTIIEHKAAVRPATLERRPFVGFHPMYRNIGILNGMGTKGTSLAPFFGNQLAQQMVHGFPIAAEADISRFARILSK